MFATSIRLQHKGIGISLTPQWCAGGAHPLLQTVWTKHRAVSHSSGLKAWWKRKWQTEVVDLSQQPGNKIDGPACFYKARLNVQYWYFPPLIIKHTLPILDWKCPSCINQIRARPPDRDCSSKRQNPQTWSRQHGQAMGPALILISVRPNILSISVRPKHRRESTKGQDEYKCICRGEDTPLRT